MKVFIVLNDFLLDFYDSCGEINKNTIYKWFDNSKYCLIFSKNMRYQIANVIESQFSMDSNTLTFKIDWNKIKKFYANDKEFLKKLEQLQKKVKA